LALGEGLSIMSKRSSDRLNPTAAALMLSAILAAAGQAPAPVPSVGGTSAVRASSQQRESTRTTPTPTQAQRTLVERIAGPGRDPRRAHNPVRQARRLLERHGVITSGRKWRQFRKHERKDPHLMALWTQILALVA
jgi:hypothetical protein